MCNFLCVRRLTRLACVCLCVIAIASVWRAAMASCNTKEYDALGNTKTQSSGTWNGNKYDPNTCLSAYSNDTDGDGRAESGTTEKLSAAVADCDCTTDSNFPVSCGSATGSSSDPQTVTKYRCTQSG